MIDNGDLMCADDSTGKERGTRNKVGEMERDRKEVRSVTSLEE